MYLVKRMGISASFITLALILALAGCSSSGGDNASSGGSTNGGAKTSTEGKPPEPVKRGNISSSIYDRGSVPADEGTIEKNRWTEWFNDNGPANVNFVSIPRWESGAKFNTLFASGSAPDLIFEYATSYRNTLISQKQLMPIDELIEQHSTEYKQFLEQNPVVRRLATHEDGKMYEFARIPGLVTNHVLFVRGDWLDKLGLQVPKTTEELFEVAKAFTEQDPDDNGTKDTYGYSLSFVSGMITDAMFENVSWVVEDGRLIRDWERMKAATEFKKRLYEAGIVDKDYLADKNGEKARQDFINGKLGFYGANGGAGGIGYNILEALRKNVPDAQIIAIELPRSEFGQFSPVINNPVQLTAAINSSAKDPVAVMKYVDFLVQESTQHMLKYGIEGTHHKIGANGCPQVIDAELNKKELDYNGDFQMLVSATTFGDCAKYAKSLDPEKPLDKEFLAIIEQADKAYLSPDRPIASITHSDYMPALPQDLQLIVTNTEAIGDMFTKAIVSGASYTIDQAMAEAKNHWDKAGGKQLEDWYANWYMENKDRAFLRADMYNFE